MIAILKGWHTFVKTKAKPRIPSSNIKSIFISVLPTHCAPSTGRTSCQHCSAEITFLKAQQSTFNGIYDYIQINMLYLVLLSWNLFQIQVFQCMSPIAMGFVNVFDESSAYWCIFSWQNSAVKFVLAWAQLTSKPRCRPRTPRIILLYPFHHAGT